MEVNQIVLGDAYELIKQVPSKSVSLIVTDPPYEYDSLCGGGIARQRKFFNELKDSNIDKGFDLALIDEFMRVLKKPNLYIWVSKKQFRKVLDYVMEKYDCSWDLIIWGKQNPAPLCSNQYLHDCEYCLYFRKGVKIMTNYETGKTIYYTPNNRPDKDWFGHPTIKPENIIENLIRNSCGGGLILDPFVGSGTTCVVAKRLGYDYLGFEINPKWHAVAVDRLNGITQKERKAGVEQLKLF